MNIREADRVRACLDCGGPSALHPAAVVTYSEEPSPETGHVGWMWWALGAVKLLLGKNGCDCACDHDAESHDFDCDRCLACRISWAIDT